jgi:hypothetical protein
MARLSTHARQRASQRGLNPQELHFVLTFGRRIFRTGIRFIFLGARDIPNGFQRAFGHLTGATLLVSGDGIVLTVYKNPNGLRVIKKKSKNRRSNATLRPA